MILLLTLDLVSNLCLAFCVNSCLLIADNLVLFSSLSFFLENLYVCDLAEWGVVIDDEGTTKQIMDEYWNKMWEFSFTGEDVDVQAVMDGLDIDRSGADASDLDDETKEMMKKAELANAGCAKSDLYDHDE